MGLAQLCHWRPAAFILTAPSRPSSVILLALTDAEAMAFSGPAPELINSRAAMLAMAAAFGAEVTTGALACLWHPFMLQRSLMGLMGQ